ncbi:MAG: helix-turn-helix transcriptional regulator [Candidatus Binatia bacterium]
MTDQFHTAPEIAAWLKVKLPTVRKWQQEGLPCIRVGRLCRYQRESVLAWLKDREQRRTSK